MFENSRQNFNREIIDQSLERKVFYFGLFVYLLFFVSLAFSINSYLSSETNDLFFLFNEIFNGINLITRFTGLFLVFVIIFMVPVFLVKAKVISVAGFIGILVLLFLMLSPVIMIVSIYFRGDNGQIYGILFYSLFSAMTVFFCMVSIKDIRFSKRMRAINFIVLIPYILISSASVVIILNSSINYFSDSSDSIITRFITLVSLIVYLVIFFLIPVFISMAKNSSETV